MLSACWLVQCLPLFPLAGPDVSIVRYGRLEILHDASLIDLIHPMGSIKTRGNILTGRRPLVIGVWEAS